MRKKWPALMIIGIIALSLFLSGCVKKEATDKKGTLKYKNENSQGEAEVGEGSKLPANFPKDVPVYKNAKITSAITNKTDQVEMMVTTLETNDSLDDVVKYYEKQLPENGFNIENRFEMENTVTFNAKKGDTRTIVAISNQDGKTTVGTNVTIGE